jgi:hypothetical protein
LSQTSATAKWKVCSAISVEQDDDTAEQICRELEMHSTLEEEIVYPRLAEIDAELELHAEEEHDKAKELIDQIRANPTTSQGWWSCSMRCNHVNEEETKAFPEMRARLGAELEDLGAAVEERKQTLRASQ